MGEKIVKGCINAGRTCRGLSRIGYSTANAICDILDNSVSNHAKNCKININKICEEYPDSRAENIRSIEICDDGDGMDYNTLLKAIDIGSSDENYTEETLSKFGLGLKSASFSQGDVLTVISGQNGKFNKVSVDVKEQKEDYIIRIKELSGEDLNIIKEYCPEGHGTIVQISEIHNKNMLSIKKIVKSLSEGNRRLGAIYYFFLKKGLTIKLRDEFIEPYDVLFEDEANRNGNLDENDWDGKTVRWIEREKKIPVSAEDGSYVTIKVTQLVHPPTMGLNVEDGQINARRDYNIDAGNYGFYIYRNDRMIRWADMLGVLTQSAYLYGFRGRIMITSDADEAFNIDVTKSHVELSDKLLGIVNDCCQEWSSKSIKAWKYAAKRVKEKVKTNPTNRTNEILAQSDIEEDLPFEDAPTVEVEQERRQRSEEIKENHRKTILEETKRILAEEEDAGDGREISDDVAQKKIKEETAEKKRIMKVPLIMDNLLYEPYYDATEHNMVRINTSHRFSQLVYDDNSDNTDLQVLFELLMYKMAEAEVRIQKNYTSYNREVIQDIINEYRRYLSESLTSLCRSEKKLLPPIGEFYE